MAMAMAMARVEGRIGKSRPYLHRWSRMVSWMARPAEYRPEDAHHAAGMFERFADEAVQPPQHQH